MDSKQFKQNQSTDSGSEVSNDSTSSDEFFTDENES